MNKKHHLTNISTVLFDGEDILYNRNEKSVAPIIRFLKKYRNISWKEFQEAYQIYHLRTCQGKIKKEDQLKLVLSLLKIDLDAEQFSKFQQIFRTYYSRV